MKRLEFLGIHQEEHSEIDSHWVSQFDPASVSGYLSAGFSLAFKWDLGERSGEEFTLESSMFKINLKCFEKFLKSEFFSLLILP